MTKSVKIASLTLIGLAQSGGLALKVTYLISTRSVGGVLSALHVVRLFLGVVSSRPSEGFTSPLKSRKLVCRYSKVRKKILQRVVEFRPAVRLYGEGRAIDLPKE